jgi:hypothetical protein
MMAATAADGDVAAALTICSVATQVPLMKKCNRRIGSTNVPSIEKDLGRRHLPAQRHHVRSLGGILRNVDDSERQLTCFQRRDRALAVRAAVRDKDSDASHCQFAALASLFWEGEREFFLFVFSFCEPRGSSV